MRFGTIYKLNEMKKKVIDFLTHNFTIAVVVSGISAILSRVNLPGRDTSWSWIFFIVLFVGGIAYSIFKK